MQKPKNLFFLLGLAALVCSNLFSGCNCSQTKGGDNRQAANPWAQENARQQAEQQRQASLHPDLKTLEKLAGLVKHLDLWSREFMSDQRQLLDATTDGAMTTQLEAFLGKAKGNKFEDLGALCLTQGALEKEAALEKASNPEQVKEALENFPAGPFFWVQGTMSEDVSKPLVKRVSLGKLVPSETLRRLERCAGYLEKSSQDKKITALCGYLKLELVCVTSTTSEQPGKLQQINLLLDQLAAKKVAGSPLENVGGLMAIHVFRDSLGEEEKKAEAAKAAVSFMIPVARIRLSDVAQALLDKK